MKGSEVLGRVAVMLLVTLGAERVPTQGRPSPLETKIVGVVVEYPSGRPMSGAVVSVSLANGTPVPVRQVTGARGEFLLSGLPSVPILVTASYKGHGSGGHGQAVPGGRSWALSLRPGEVRKIQLRVWKGASIAGTIRDSTGEPAVNAAVTAYRRVSTGASRYFAVAASGKTDDRGEYRLTPLQAGTCVLVVEFGSRDSVVRELVRTASGFLIDVHAGEELLSQDLSIAPATGVSVTGGVNALPDDRIVAVTLMSLDVPDDLAGITARTVVVKSPHQFAFDHVTQGRYRAAVVSFPIAFPQQGIQGGVRTLRGVAPQRATGFTVREIAEFRTYFGEVDLVVGDQPVSGVELHVREGSRVAGRVVVEADTPPGPENVTGSLLVFAADGRDLGGSPPLASIEADGQFLTAQLPPGKYILAARFERGGFFLKERLLSRAPVGALTLTRDTEDYRLVYTSRRTTLQGSVVDSRPNPGRSVVFVFPEARESWRDVGRAAAGFAAIPCHEDGSYQIEGLPPGDYLLTAVAAEEAPEEWIVESVLDRLSARADRVRLRLDTVVSWTIRLGSL